MTKNNIIEDNTSKNDNKKIHIKNKYTKKCAQQNCDKYSRHKTIFCRKHNKTCCEPNCDNKLNMHINYCDSHFDENKIKSDNAKICAYQNCNKYIIQHAIFCKKHSKICSEPNCNNKLNLHINYCDIHFDKNRIKSKRKKHICNVQGCNKYSRGKSILCKRHNTTCKFNNCNITLTDHAKYCNEHNNLLRVLQDLVTLTQKYDKEKKILNKKLHIDTEILIEILNFQNYNCFHCKNKVILERGKNNPLQISIDRICNEIPHIKNNIIISCIFCNYGRNVSSISEWSNMICIIKNNITNINHVNHIFNNSWASILCTNARKKHFKICNTLANFNISVDWIKAQPLICHYTGINLFPSIQPWYLFQPSLDRIDNTKGYTKDNIVITCRGMNTARNQTEYNKFVTFINSLRFDAYNNNNSIDIFIKKHLCISQI